MKISNHLQKSVKKNYKAYLSSVIFTLIGSQALAGELEQAKRIHDRLTGVPPSENILVQMKDMIEEDGNGIRAARLAIDNDENHDFYNVTLKNWIAPWTNEEQSVFTDLNDYIATLVGVIRDDIDFREGFYTDIIYVGDGDLGLPGYANNNNAHYEALQDGLERNGASGFSLKDDLVQARQSEVANLPVDAVAGVVTSRAAAKAFFSAGTNRANFRFTLLNHLCMDLEQVHDTTLSADRIRQDVSRSPGGDARVFLNTCLGCHSGMDPMAQAFAYHEYYYNEENGPAFDDGFIQYGGEVDDPEQGFSIDGVSDPLPGGGLRVQQKYHINSATFPYGYITPDDSWENYWREGQNSVIGWDPALPGEGEGASSMVQELVHTEAFASCQVNKVFKAVCLRDPHDQTDHDKIYGASGLIENFKSSNYSIKTVFAETADYCKGE